MRIFGPNTDIRLLLLALLLGVTAGYAQAPGGAAPAGHAVSAPVLAPLFTGNSKGPSEDGEETTADNAVLSGAQNLSPDVNASRRSYWQPYFDLTATLDTNPLGVGSTINLAPWGSFYGGTDLHWTSHRSDLSVNYLGGAVVSQYKGGDAPLQQLSLGEKLSWRHATISLFDQFGYFPEAVSEFFLPTDPEHAVNQETSLQPIFLPNQSIVTTAGQELANSFIGELDVTATPQSSFTFLESYSIVRFFNTGLLDPSDTTLQAGFNHQITRSDTVALLYRFVAFRFSNLYQPMDGHVIQLAWGRRVRGRLAFQLSAGPELGLLSTAGPAPAAGAAPTINTFRHLYWTADGSMTYEIRRTVLKLGYDRGVTDGAGFLRGAISDQVYGSLDGQLSRTLRGELIGGYARNQGLVATTQQPANAVYRDWFAGVTISHALSRRASIFLSYQLQRQVSNFVCAGVVCGNDFMRHLISVGVTGRSQPRPIG